MKPSGFYPPQLTKQFIHSNLYLNYKQMNGHFIILKSLVYTYLGSINNKHIKQKI